ncbi:centrosomal protein of 295 kDa [Dunckerocampus dactyliophorus]|uniref:centrosomal protein of 295 kDa n=1 Tax=Dunckerocampus dactyliophorus TaxID=161453 RepID=UPI00240628F7|nr:centrosomal protein of 295 kDa [Dunckerocampus dactyliophorus]
MNRGATKLRLSPNEEAQLIREEKERRRKLRLQQVREQQKLIALQMRQNVEQRRLSELEQLEEELREEWERERSDKLLALQALYEQSLQLVGQGQRMAKENEPDIVAIAQKEAEDHAKAAERFRGALSELKSQRLKEREIQNQTINARKKALQEEKKRSAKVASLPAPQPRTVLDIVPERPHVGNKSGVSAFASTRYHRPIATVDREEDAQQTNASREAELAMRKLQDSQRDYERKRAEQQEKARLRGKSALRKEHRLLDNKRLLLDMKRLSQVNNQRKQQQVSQMPNQIFQPPYKIQEMKDDFQKQMEFAFEDMYTKERKIKGDLVGELVPEPLPEVSTSDQDHELDVMLEEPTTSEPGDQQVDRKDAVQSAQAEEPACVEPPRHDPKQPLKKLLNRIRNQRNRPTRHGSRVPASHSPSTVVTQVPVRDTTVWSQVVPERDTANLQQVPRRDTITESEVGSERTTTIDTGSLSSQPLLVEPQKPTKLPSSASSVEPTGQSIPADGQRPDERSTKIMDFEEERQLRQMELEMEKQQQLALLKELDDQRAQLEQLLLLEAQQEVPLHVQETHGPELPVADEDKHARRIRDYQKRLLEQNRTHKRSVEVARQRLEEYQHALQMHHNMAAVSLPPAVVPQGTLHPSMPSTQHARVPTPPLLPAASAVPARIHDGPQTAVKVASRRSAGPALPPSLPSSSSSFLPGEVASSSNSSRNQTLDANALLSSSVVPSQSVTRELIPPPAVTREIFPPQMITREPRPPKQVTRELLPPQAVTTESVTTASIPFQKATGPIPTVTESGPPLASLPRSESPADDISERPRRGEVQRAPHERPQVEEESLDKLGQRQEDNLELLRQQKETLQALIKVEAQPPSEVLPPEDTGQTRIKLLASLLKAIEKSNRESSPPKEEEGPQHQAPSTIETAMLPPTRAAKPPVTRVRLGTTMKEQHELSVIQEVETPINTSQVADPEDVFSVPQHTIDWSLQSSVATEHTLQTPSTSSSGQQSAERPASVEMGSTGSRLHLSRQRLPMGTGETPDSSEHGSHHHISSDSGWGADYLGPELTTQGSPADDGTPPGDATLLSAHGPPDPDSFSTTLSTGSYITSEPEANAAKSPALSTMEPRLGSHFLGTSSLLSPHSSMSDSPAAGPSHTSQLAFLFRDSNVQRIIDRYTKELDVSFSTADSEGSGLVEHPSSVSQQSLHQVTERRGEDDEASQAAHTSDLSVKPILEELSVIEGQDSFRPLIGQLDQSSCLVADHKDAAMEQLVGQPTAHSSMIGPLLGLSSGIGQSGWGFTAGRQVSQQSSDRWLRSEQGLLANQLTSQTQQSISWLDVCPESTMRPLVGELDVSSGQHSSSSGERTYTDLGALTEPTVPSYPSLPPEAPSLSTSVPGLNPLLQNQPSAIEAGSQHNEDTANSSEGQLSSGELSVSTHSDFRSHDGESDSERSTESLRAEDSSCHEATSLLVVSALMSPTAQLSHSSASDTLSACSILLQDVEQPEASVPCCDLPPEEPKHDQSLNLMDITTKLLEATNEKGILEQSQITLLSLTDTTLQDSIVSEEEGMWEEALTKERQKGQQSEVTIEESSIEPFDVHSPTHAGTLLEFNWGPSRDLQGVLEQKRNALLERSTRRVEELKAKAALVRTGQHSKAAVELGVRSEEQPPVLCKAKIRREVQHDTKSNTARSTLSKQQKPQPQAVSMSMLHNPAQVKKGKQDLSEMHRRTQRLYEQLEEVKQQQDIRSRQEAYANNREKAKAFHMKTLQKLRAKQTRR